jgi:hypothetical protein
MPFCLSSGIDGDKRQSACMTASESANSNEYCPGRRKSVPYDPDRKTPPDQLTRDKLPLPRSPFLTNTANQAAWYGR